MKQAQNLKRTRGRGRKPHGTGQRTFDSNGPDVKIRGSASHIYEKYQALARDAHAAGDRIGAENYLQHAEHYYRILTANQPAANGRHQNGAPETRSNGAENGGDEEWETQEQPEEAPLRSRRSQHGDEQLSSESH